MERIQLTINNYSKAASNLIVCGDLNFEFIQWPEGDFKGRGVSTVADKIQASNFLDLCEYFDLSNISVYPTRKSNVLDLLCMNSDGISFKDRYINSKLLDHNLVEFTIDIKAGVSQDPVTNLMTTIYSNSTSQTMMRPGEGSMTRLMDLMLSPSRIFNQRISLRLCIDSFRKKRRLTWRGNIVSRCLDRVKGYLFLTMLGNS